MLNRPLFARRLGRSLSLLLAPILVVSFAIPGLAKKRVPPAPVAAIPAPPPAKVISSGDYVDAAGALYPWHITPSHMLDWNGSPYVPVGGTFTPHYWVTGQTDAAWNEDVSALKTLERHGVTDILLTAGALGLTKVPAAAVQRTIDYLDAQGFHYGLKIADFPNRPLTGYLIQPAIYRNPSPPEQGVVKFSDISGLKGAIYMLAAQTSGQVIESGAAAVAPDGTASVTIRAGGPGEVLLLYPRREFAPGDPESRLPDLWQSYGDYRDQLLAFFNQIHLGKGFRFFLDPLTKHLSITGDINSFVPTSAGFHLDFQAWLDQKYGRSLDQLDRSWGIENHDMPDFATAARCIPLWSGYKGIAALYDPVNNISYEIFNDSRIESAYWSDLQAFKLDSTRGFMDDIADALKQAVADVPIIYTWTQHSALFSDQDLQGGYDGLGIEAYGHGLDLTQGSAAYVYAQAEETPKTTWLIASATASAPPSQKKTPGFLSQAVLFDDWDGLKQIGARGFFVRSLQRLPSAKNKYVSLVGLPEQLSWLGTYAAVVQASTRSLETIQPTVLWYPQNIDSESAGVRLLSDGVWWLPTFKEGSPLVLGPSLAGYSLIDPTTNQPINVLWSPGNAVTAVEFPFPNHVTPTLTTAGGTPIPIKQNHGAWIIPVGDSPEILLGVEHIPLPIGAPDAEEAEAIRLVALAKQQKINVEIDTENLFRAENDTHNTIPNARIRYTEFAAVCDSLINALRPYAWLEGESSSDNDFTTIIANPDVSSGAYLTLDTNHNPINGGILDSGTDGDYSASYDFVVNSPGTYEIWMAGTPPGADASPFSWQIDHLPPNPSTNLSSKGGLYAGKFAWSDLGPVKLYPGKHRVKIIVTGRRAKDQRYYLSLDAFCIARFPFQPNGPLQPGVSAWLPSAALSPPAPIGKQKR